VEATQDTGAFVALSGTLKRVAVKLSKICNDLRLLSSGPRAGLAEIRLPPMQPGSSIMPGKVNPVIPEVVNQVCFQVIGNDLTVTMAAEAGQLQLNVFEPVIAFNIFQSVDMLTQACIVLRERCIVGIEANRDRIRASAGAQHRHRHRARPVHRLRARDRRRPRGARHRSRRLRAGAREGMAEQGRSWMTILSPDAMTRPRRGPGFNAERSTDGSAAGHSTIWQRMVADREVGSTTLPEFATPLTAARLALRTCDSGRRAGTRPLPLEHRDTAGRVRGSESEAGPAVQPCR
jgi:hypothetical protein